ncbi:hypothetical protein RB195_005832 [Necator americanus]|uniref:C2H2-type domain-containing protein n=1 Tax=Necator americanus TaxID=51031 RepID=A0ABR1BPT8_NECAM
MYTYTLSGRKHRKKRSKPAPDRELNRRASRCPGCSVRVNEQRTFNEHCCEAHGEEYAIRSERFNSEDEFFRWKRELEKEHQTCWYLGRSNKFGPFVRRHFFCYSCRAPFESSSSKICTSFITATFCRRITVRYCIAHFGHRTTNFVDHQESDDYVGGHEATVGLISSEFLEMQQNDHSFQRCSPSYVVVSKKVDKKADGNPVKCESSTVENSDQQQSSRQ